MPCWGEGGLSWSPRPEGELAREWAGVRSFRRPQPLPPPLQEGVLRMAEASLPTASSRTQGYQPSPQEDFIERTHKILRWVCRFDLQVERQQPREQGAQPSPARELAGWLRSWPPVPLTPALPTRWAAPSPQGSGVCPGRAQLAPVQKHLCWRCPYGPDVTPRPSEQPENPGRFRQDSPAGPRRTQDRCVLGQSEPQHQASRPHRPTRGGPQSPTRLLGLGAPQRPRALSDTSETVWPFTSRK